MFYLQTEKKLKSSLKPYKILHYKVSISSLNKTKRRIQNLKDKTKKKERTFSIFQRLSHEASCFEAVFLLKPIKSYNFHIYHQFEINS